MRTRQLASTTFGVLMIAAAVGTGRPSSLTAVVVVLAAIAVVAGQFSRAAATGAVLAAGCLIVLSDQHAWFAAVAGVFAAAYMVLRFSTLTAPTAIGIVGFAVVGLVATGVPLRLAWWPLVAPVVAVILFAVMLDPFVRSVRASRVPPPPGSEP